MNVIVFAVSAAKERDANGYLSLTRAFVKHTFLKYPPGRENTEACYEIHWTLYQVRQRLATHLSITTLHANETLRSRQFLCLDGERYRVSSRDVRTEG